MSIGSFIQDEVLGMKWLNGLIGMLLSFLGLNADSRIGASVQFFLYDTIKIMVLLGFLECVSKYITTRIMQGGYGYKRNGRKQGSGKRAFHSKWQLCGTP